MAPNAELGALLLNEPYVAQNPLDQNFSQALTKLFYKHKFHELSLAQVKIWMASFLVSLKSVDQPGVWFQVLGAHLDVSDENIYLILATENPGIIFSYVFDFNSTSGQKDNFKNSQIMRVLRERWNATKTYQFNYSLELEYDGEHEKHVYQVKLVNIGQVNYFPYVDHRNFGQKTISNLVRMRKINAQTALDFTSGNQQSLVGLLIDFFSDKQFKNHLAKLGTGQLTTDFLLVALHAVLTGHFQHTYGLDMNIVLNMNGQISTLTVNASSPAQTSPCNRQPVVFWTEQPPKDVHSLFARFEPPALASFASETYLSMYLFCANNECIMRSKQQLYETRYTPIRPTYFWRDGETEMFVNMLVRDLAVLIGQHQLGPFLTGYFMTEKFSRLFLQRLVLTPHVTSSKSSSSSSWNNDYYSFVLMLRSNVALVVNVAEKPTSAKAEELVNFKWFSGIPFRQNNQTIMTQTINIVREDDPRVKLAKNSQDNYKLLPTSFLANYNVIVERKMQSKLVQHATNTDDQRNASAINQELYMYQYKYTILNNINTLLPVMKNMPKIYRSQSDLMAMLDGFLLQHIDTYKLTESTTVYRDNTVTKSAAAVNEFATLKIFGSPYSDDLVRQNIQSVKEQVKSSTEPITVELLMFFFDKLPALDSYTFCRHETSSSTICTRNDMNTTSTVYNYASIFTNVENTTTNTCDNVEDHSSDRAETKSVQKMFTPLVEKTSHNEQLSSVHSLLLYSQFGMNLEKLASIKLQALDVGPENSLAIFTNIINDVYLKQCPGDPRHQFEYETLAKQGQEHQVVEDELFRKFLTKTFTQLKRSYKYHKDLTILPADDNLYVGIVGNETSTDQHYTAVFSMGNMQNIRAVEKQDNVMVVSEGAKALLLGSENDLIIVDKASDASGFINAQTGSNTVVLIDLTDTDIKTGSITNIPEQNQPRDYDSDQGYIERNTYADGQVTNQQHLVESETNTNGEHTMLVIELDDQPTKPVTSIKTNQQANMMTLENVMKKHNNKNTNTPDNDQMLNLVVLNAQHLVGAQNSVEHLELQCGLETVNLRGGEPLSPDSIRVDVKQCQNEVLVTVNHFTQVDHLSTNGKLKYEFVGRPAKMVFHPDNNTDADDKCTVVIDLKTGSFDGTPNITCNQDNKCDIIFGKDDDKTELINVPSSVLIRIEGHTMQLINGRAYLTGNCNYPEFYEYYELLSSIETYHNEIRDLNMIFVHKCPGNASLVFTGIDVFNQTHDSVLPQNYTLFENDLDAPETIFLKQYTPMTRVYKIDQKCATSDNDGKCKPAFVSALISNETWVDLRDLTRPFEDRAFKIDLEFHQQPAGQATKVVGSIEVRAISLSGNQWVPLAQIKILNGSVVFQSHQFKILTSRNRHHIDAKQGRFFREPLVQKKGAQHQITVDNLKRLELVGHQVGGERVHGDQVVLRQNDDVSKSRTSIYVNLEPKMCGIDQRK